MPEKKNYDVIILGTGPAGLQAAIHAARKKVSVLVLGKETRSSVYHAHIGIQFDDEMKYIDTNKKMETNVPGVFAAGDICGPPWQMAKAVGEGCIAGMAAAAHAKKMRSSV